MVFHRAGEGTDGRAHTTRCPLSIPLNTRARAGKCVCCDRRAWGRKDVAIDASFRAAVLLA